jgi:hypothetical protein
MQREWPNEYFCPLYYRNLETAAHLMTECPTSRFVWDHIGTSYGLPSLRSKNWLRDKALSDWFNELSGPSCSAKEKGERSVIILTCWTLWKECNARIFERQEKERFRLVTNIKDEARLWATTGAKDLSILIDQPISE